MWKLICVTLLIYIFFLAHFTLHEWVLPHGVDHEKSFHFPAALLLWVDVFNALTAFLVVTFLKLGKPRSPFRYLLVAIPQQIGLVASNYAVKFVDYPTVSLFKSAKPIVVLLCSIILFRVSVTRRRFLVVVVITTGLIVFGFQGGISRSTVGGLFLILVSLISDAIYVPMVDKLKVGDGGPFVVMFYTYMWATLFIILSRFREVFESFVFRTKNVGFIWKLALFGLTGSLAHVSLFTAIGMVDGIVIAIITTTRKFFTILLSSIIFRHKLTWTQWLGVLIVFLGLGMEIEFKRAEVAPYALLTNGRNSEP